jgi:hypothetical protein
MESQGRIGSGGKLAIGLAVLGSLVATANEVVHFRTTGTVDWGHAALILAVPVFIYAVVSSRKA